MVKNRKTVPRLRIGGVVKAMNQAREVLGSGIPPVEVDAFRSYIRSVVDSVEQICRNYSISPGQLPAPTYRAYSFLKSLNLQELPVREDTGQQDKQKVRIANLIALCNTLQNQMGELVEKIPPRGKRPSWTTPEVLDLHKRIETQALRVEQICREAASTPAELPAQSRRAYQWLKFLAEEDNLQLHLSSLQIGMEASRKAACRSKLPASRRKLPIRLVFFHLPALYRARLQKGTLHLVANEGYIAASQSVLEDLVCAALYGKNSLHLSRVRQFAASEAFSEVLLSLELGGENSAGGEDREPVSQGQFYDLVDVFERVNAEYFEGRLDRPRLTWNKTITHRKLGHYQPAGDTVMISITLDGPQIPAYLLDFVMYHELLHKDLGFRESNGRRYAHTRNFREKERRFRFYSEAQDFLRQLGQHLKL